MDEIGREEKQSYDAKKQMQADHGGCSFCHLFGLGEEDGSVLTFVYGYRCTAPHILNVEILLQGGWRPVHKSCFISSSSEEAVADRAVLVFGSSPVPIVHVSFHLLSLSWSHQQQSKAFPYLFLE